jgi:predicted aspartyl protease
LQIRNGTDPKKPCEIARFGAIDVTLVHNSALVPVMVNGVETAGLLDTGAEDTLITPALAAAAKVTVLPDRPTARLYGIGGGFKVTPLSPQTLQVGQLRATHPKGVFGSTFLGHSGKDLGVLVGASFVDGFDWDLDFPHGKMTAYRTANCHDIDPPWTTKSTGLPITRGTDTRIVLIASLLALRVNITIPVVFDTDTLRAVFDTGAQQSYLTLDGAHKAGLTNRELALDPEKSLVSADGTRVMVRIHKIKEFIVGEQLERDFPMLVAESFDRRQKYDMILGMDWIADHHIWLSYTTDSLYIDSGESKPAGWTTVQMPGA